MFCVYVLYSSSYDRIYTGYTSDLINRFHSHNFLATKGYTIKYRPWIVVYVEFFESKNEAMAHEKFLKSGKGREFIHQTILPVYKK